MEKCTFISRIVAMALLWRKVRGLLERDPLLKKNPIKGVLADLELAGVDDGTARLVATSGAVADLVSRNYNDMLRMAFVRGSGDAVQVVKISAVWGTGS